MADTDEEHVVAEADDESDRELKLVESEGGWWTVVDSERGAIGDAPTKAGAFALLEQILEEMDVDIPDVEPAEPSERPDRDPKLPGGPSPGDEG